MIDLVNHTIFFSIGAKNGRDEKTTLKKRPGREGLKDEDQPAYDEWKATHKCKFNYNGSSGGMEKEGAKRIWERSCEKHDLQYTEFYGDGDSKAFDIVKDTYGQNSVERFECVGPKESRDKAEKFEEEGKRTWWPWKIDRPNNRPAAKLLWDCYPPKQKQSCQHESWSFSYIISCCFIEGKQLPLSSLS